MILEEPRLTRRGYVAAADKRWLTYDVVYKNHFWGIFKCEDYKYSMSALLLPSTASTITIGVQLRSQLFHDLRMIEIQVCRLTWILIEIVELSWSIRGLFR